MRTAHALLTAVLLATTGAGLTAATASATPAAPAELAAPAAQGDFVVSKAEYNKMFPNHKAFYNYEALVKAMKKYPAFADKGNAKTKKREAAAFLANVHHETGGGRYIVEQNKANWPSYCDPGLPFGCPAGQSAYHGRGPIQLSTNGNYKAAGDALGVDLLHKPGLVQKNPVLAWKTGLWFWMTQTGAGSMIPHKAMVQGKGFGQTIRSINGAIECNGGNPAQVQSRVNTYKKFAKILDVKPGNNLSC
ncbi:chitinase [Streptomyces sp. NBC_00287]|uniref:chitinase n=1 Tax=Streptomyces sp. NBC_00287 TaxID=2975702 RepID=UPI003FA736F0